MENEKKRNIIFVVILAIVIIAAVIVGFLVFNSFFNNNIDPGKNTEPETVTTTENDNEYKYISKLNKDAVLEMIKNKVV